jgi:hypothetical protein
MLSGYKTYIAGAIMVITEGIKAVFPEYVGICTAIQTIAAGLGFVFLRAGVNKVS